MMSEAFAQSNVTIYGVADAGYAYSRSAPEGSKHSQTFSGIDSGNRDESRLGFMDKEALGNGVKAIFRMEFGTNIDGNNHAASNDGFSSTRWAYVGVDTHYGEVTLGRLKSASKMYFGDNSANGLNANGALNQLSGGTYPFIKNAIAY